MERRTLRLHTYEEVLADAESLLVSGYDRAGSWSLGQACHHLSAVMEMSMDSLPSRLSWPMRLLARWFALGGILKHHVSRRRFPAPKYMQPPTIADDREGMERLRNALERLKSNTAPMQPSPVFGQLSTEQWREVHLWHCEHHFSFLLPKSSGKTVGALGNP